ncbi:MAG TPA: pyridoxal 5'-phosphate synthase glutaminase subunit PdxT [Acidimicrobiia bacterium]|nr:pyridoxal 5'-phosphate synthase glutaminase subunit PdxT [Acidimicrobiia bacterium]
MKVGVLALQGAFREHREVLDALGVETVEVRTAAELGALDALILPGGESTTMSQLLDSSGVRAPLAELLTDGLPVLGTCAGMILLAREVVDGRPDQESFGAIDVAVRRNAYGRQRDSFEADLAVDGLPGGPFPGVFIRAPRIESVGDGVEVLAAHEGVPVLARQGAVVVTSFHPELSGDLRLHEFFLTESERT